MFLSRSFNWWYHEWFFRRLGIALFVLGLLLIWLGQYRKWSGWKMRLGHGLSLLALLWVVVVFATGAIGLGRGKPVFLYNLLNLKRTIWEGPALGVGKHTIVFDFKSDGPGLGKGGTGVLSVDGKEVARNSMEHTTPITFAEDESFDIGEDTRTGVALLRYRYEPPFKFTGSINKLTFNLAPEQLTTEERQELHEGLAQAHDER